jgi:hypothetical protein
MVDSYFGDLADDVRSAEGFLWRAWRDASVLERLSDDDPCPCDQPNARWGTCHKWTGALGTAEYVPFTDRDLVHFTPYDPNKARPPVDVDELLARQPTDFPVGPHIQTFTFTLPFTLGLEDAVGHTMTVADDWADPDDAGHFGRTPTVRIRLHNEEVNTRNLWLGDPTRALQRLYGERADVPPEVVTPDLGTSYEQWVSLETPGARLKSDRVTDPAFAFHRSLTALEAFLRAMDLAVSDPRVTTVTTHDLGPVVFRGAITKDGRWHRLGNLLMHPDAFPFALPVVPFDSIRAQFLRSFNDLQHGRPFLLASLWHGRALRAFRFRGDTADCVVSLQTAVESMMYDLFRSLLVDEGRTGAEIGSELGRDVVFKSLVTRDVATRLGGDWHLTGNGTVATYWASLYTIRNRVVHTGYTPDVRQAEDAMQAYLDIREFVSTRLWARWPKYPRTLVAKVGVNGLERRGWMTKRVRDAYAQLAAEPNPFYWPDDAAGRSR